MGQWRRVLSVLGLLVLGLGGLLPAIAVGATPVLPLPGPAGITNSAAPPAQAGGPNCALLDDPQVRRRMSAPFEEGLLEACGRLPAPRQTWPAGAPLWAGIDQGGPDARVNVVDPLDWSTIQSETSIALNRSNGTVCVNYNDSYHYRVQGLSYIGFANSTDGGQTFNDTATNYLPQGNGGRARGDPTVVWRASDGLFYASSIHENIGSGDFGLGFWRSTDDCTTFEWVGMVHNYSSDDKELLAVDNNPASPYYGRFYVAWMEFGAGRMSFSYSDNGTTWSTPVALSYDSVQGAWPTVAPNGDVYVAWLRWGAGDSIYMEAARSTNGGSSFTRVTDPRSNVINPYDDQASYNCGRDSLKANVDDGIRYLPSPQIAVGPDGCLHVVYSYDPDGHGTGDVVNSYYRRSCDNGTTWGPEVLLNDDGTLTDQFFPAVAVNANNVVAASWYDRRLDPANNYLFARYMALSTDGGVTWGPNEQVSDVASPVFVQTNPFNCYHGDYDQLTADPAAVYFLWSDDRVFFNGHYDPDVYVERWPLACEPVQGADFDWMPVTPTVGQAVVFTGTATGTLPITYSWRLDVGSWQAGQVVTYTYDTPGVYTVVLTATNCATATATTVHTITVVPCEPVQEVDFTWTPLTPTVGEVVVFSSSLAVGDGWVTTTIGEGELVYAHNSLGLDSAGLPHISYDTYHDPNNVLAYAWYDGAAWYTTTVDVGGDFNSLAPDVAGRPHISYFDHYHFDVKYAWYDGSSWMTMTVDHGSDSYFGAYTSLALDPAGYPHISYLTNVGSGELRYAYYDGISWTIQVVDTGVGVDTLQKSYTSLALDSAGRPHISYCDTTPNCHLKYARFNGTTWVTETVPGTTMEGRFSSLQLDSDDHPHISYWEEFNGALRYAYHDGATWNVEVVDSGGYLMGLFTSLELDSHERPNILYVDGDNGLLKYARFDGTVWRIETAVAIGSQGGFPSLDLDSADHPHASYAGGFPRPLCYAWKEALPSPPIAYSWSLGDGSLATGPAITHTYGAPGVYTVVLTATNCGGATATAVHTVTVAPPPCEPVHDAAFTWTPVTPTVGEPVAFAGTATGTLPISYSWKLDVGSWRVGQVVTYTYDTPGVYTVVLTATNCATATAVVTREVTVLPLPCTAVHDAAFVWQPLTPTVGEEVVFTGTATGTLPITYSWRLDVGSWQAGQVVTYSYTLPGLYTVTLAATNCGTATAAVTHTITVAPLPCEPVEIVTVTRSISGCEVTLGAVLSGTAPFTYLWQVRALTSTLPGPVFDLGSSGTYTVTLAVSNCGGEDQRTFPVTVTCPAPGWKVYLPVVFK